MPETSNSPEKDLVLVVDDIPKNIQLLGKILSGEGYQVAAQKEPEKVIDSARKFNPDIILLDVMMPGMDGFEVCRQIKKDDDLKEIPVIFITGKVEKTDIIEGLKSGGSDYVTKPFNTEELLARIETHLELKKSKDYIKEQNLQLKSLNDTSNKILSVISHDIRSPVNAITGFSDMMLEDLEEVSDMDRSKESLQFINSSARRISQLLENLVSWARLQSGHLEPNKEKFRIYDLVENEVMLLSAVAAAKNVELIYQDGDAMGYGDRRMIETVVRNLLSNAIKFCNENDTVELLFSEDENSWRLTVKDSGVGMPEEVKMHLFDKDNRPTKSGTNNEKGTGLGLILCKDLIEMHDGKITVESEVGRGTTFKIEMPLLN